MARDDPHFRLRIPEGLRRRVAAAAEQNNRSMTAEIIARLQKTFLDPEELTDALTVPQLRAMSGMYSKLAIIHGNYDLNMRKLDAKEKLFHSITIDIEVSPPRIIWADLNYPCLTQEELEEFKVEIELKLLKRHSGGTN